MNLPIFTKLHEERLISDQSLERITNAEKAKLFSIHWELRTVLYLGVLLLTGGLGILIYKNIDSIGHHVILAAIALLCAGCFIYCERKKLPFSFNKVNHRIRCSITFFFWVVFYCLRFSPTCRCNTTLSATNTDWQRLSQWSFYSFALTTSIILGC